MKATRTWEPLYGNSMERLNTEPLRWQTPTTVTVVTGNASGPWSDLALAAMWGVMAMCHDHTFQIVTRDITKAWAWARGYMATDPLARMHDGIRSVAALRNGDQAMHWTRDAWPLPNVWVIAEVTSQAEVIAQGHMLAEFPAAVRGLRLTHLSGPIDFGKLLGTPGRCLDCGSTEAYYATRTDNLHCHECKRCNLATLPGMDWIIADYDGANHDWLRGIRDQAMEARVPLALQSTQVTVPRLDGEVYDGRPGDHA